MEKGKFNVTKQSIDWIFILEEVYINCMYSFFKLYASITKSKFLANLLKLILDQENIIEKEVLC